MTSNIINTNKIAINKISIDSSLASGSLVNNIIICQLVRLAAHSLVIIPPLPSIIISSPSPPAHSLAINIIGGGGMECIPKIHAPSPNGSLAITFHHHRHNKSIATPIRLTAHSIRHTAATIIHHFTTVSSTTTATTQGQSSGCG